MDYRSTIRRERWRPCVGHGRRARDLFSRVRTRRVRARRNPETLGRRGLRSRPWEIDRSSDPKASPPVVQIAYRRRGGSRGDGRDGFQRCTTMSVLKSSRGRVTRCSKTKIKRRKEKRRRGKRFSPWPPESGRSRNTTTTRRRNDVTSTAYLRYTYVCVYIYIY